MVRILIEFLLPLLLVAQLFWGDAEIERRLAAPSDGARAPWWGSVPWLSLAVAGVACAAVVLSIVVLTTGEAARGVYVPAHMDNGRLVPGRILPGVP